MTALETVLTVVALIAGVNMLGLGWLIYVYRAENKPARRERDAAMYRMREVSP